MDKKTELDDYKKAIYTLLEEKKNLLEDAGCGMYNLSLGDNKEETKGWIFQIYLEGNFNGSMNILEYHFEEESGEWEQESYTLEDIYEREEENLEFFFKKIIQALLKKGF